jgi:hypothetical protein
MKVNRAVFEQSAGPEASVLRHSLFEFQNMCYSEAFSLNRAHKESFDGRGQGAPFGAGGWARMA